MKRYKKKRESFFSKIVNFTLTILIACAIGILGIAIFAVPAGLIGSAFTEVMDADNHNIAIEENKKRIHLAFERKMCRYTRLQVAPLNLSIQDIIARMRMTQNEIIEAVVELKLCLEGRAGC